jgi:hypothetical protein
MVGKEWLGWSQHVRRFLGEEEGLAAVLGLFSWASCAVRGGFSFGKHRTENGLY